MSRTVTRTFSRVGNAASVAQNHRQNRFAADRFELFAVMRGLVGAARAAIFRRIHIQKALDHLIVVERGQQQRRGFPRAHNQFSWTIGHRNFSSCTRLRRAPQQEQVFVRKKEKARKIHSRAFRWLSLILSVVLTSYAD